MTIFRKLSALLLLLLTPWVMAAESIIVGYAALFAGPEGGLKLIESFFGRWRRMTSRHIRELVGVEP